MCGILAILSSSEGKALRVKAIEASKIIRHRGPDWSGYKVIGNHAFCHERLAIVDPASGSQPLQTADQRLTLTVNGEIYNHLDIRDQFAGSFEFQTGSDCEVFLPLYLAAPEDPASWLNRVRGDFAFVLYDAQTNEYIAARDHLGICPLYIGWAPDGAVMISSEMKAIKHLCTRHEIFPPGSFYRGTTRKIEEWYLPAWKNRELIPSNPVDLPGLRAAFTDAVVKRMMSDVPWGVLLSGGLDSSLVASIACRHAEQRVEESGRQSPDRRGGKEAPGKAWYPRIHSFSVGLAGSPDLIAAASVAEFLGTVHHEMVFTIEEGLDAVSDVVYHLETYDVTSIRAATPMFLMSRKIRAMGIKMVLSGEGADEIFGGHLYFHKAPDAKQFHQECVDKVNGLHLFDCNRANKATMAWAIEARVPFLDYDFLEYAMNIDPAGKMVKKGGIEKEILRQAFDTPETPYLPHDVLYRQKEQFSDGVGYNWIDSLKEAAESHVSDGQFAAAEDRFPHNPPQTKEGYYIRDLFAKHFPEPASAKTVPGGPSIACSTAAAVKWDESWAAQFGAGGECSGRSVGVHADAYKT